VGLPEGVCGHAQGHGHLARDAGELSSSDPFPFFHSSFILCGLSVLSFPVPGKDSTAASLNSLMLFFYYYIDNTSLQPPQYFRPTLLRRLQLELLRDIRSIHEAEMGDLIAQSSSFASSERGSIWEVWRPAFYRRSHGGTVRSATTVAVCPSSNTPSLTFSWVSRARRSTHWTKITYSARWGVDKKQSQPNPRSPHFSQWLARIRSPHFR
jgi:hypothetical protein